LRVYVRGEGTERRVKANAKNSAAQLRGTVSKQVQQSERRRNICWNKDRGNRVVYIEGGWKELT